MPRIGALKNPLSLPLLAALVASPPAFARATCAKATLVQAESCAELAVEGDLSLCHDTLASLPSIKCSKGAREVRLVGKKGVYIAELTHKDGAWGASSWEMGPFRKESLRSPAGNRPLPATVTQPNPAAKEAPPAVPAAPAAELSPPTAPVAGAPPAIQVSGYFDAYVAHNFNRPRPSTPAAGSAVAAPQTQLRFYDWTSDQLTLNLAELTFKFQRGEVNVLVDLDFGQQADLNAQVPTVGATGGPTPGLVDEISKHLGQAFLTYSPAGVRGLTFDIGKMYTHVGLEVPKARDNWNYSRSTLFGYGGPFWHTGVHAGYAVIPDRLSAGLYLYNGWNTIYANGANPTYGAQLRWTPNARTAVTYNYIGGAEQAGNNSNWRHVHEANATFACSEQVTAAVDTLYGTERAVTVASGATVDARWGGAQGGFKWQFAQRASIAPRFEYYRDADGYTLGGDGQSLMGLTLTPAYQLSEGLELRLELRHDRSSRGDRFVSADGGSATQSTLLLGVLYTF